MNVLLTVVMPAYNEQDCIEAVVTQWSNFLNQHFPNRSRLIVVNDGSKDNTGKILDQLATQNPLLVAVTQPNGGHGNAAIYAYKKALELGTDYVFQTDSDDQFVCEDVMKLWEKRSESNFVMGYRQERFDAPFRLFVTRVLKYSLFFIYGTMIADSNIPFRLIKGSFLQKLLAQLPTPTPFAPNIFLAVMARKQGQNTFDIPITHKSRLTGEVSIRKMKLLKVCWQSFKELAAFRWELNSKVKNL
jgi:dolichol-phosphate mannosyltransferase